MQGQPPDLEWKDGDVPVATRFDDPYFSLGNGLSETAHVFLAGNGLPGRLRDGFHIAELGFGTGLNLLAALKLWRDTNQTGTLHFTTFEAYPMAPADMARAQAAFPEIAALAEEMAPHLGKTAFSLPGLAFQMQQGDARQTLAAWDAQADAWFLDGFSPAKNPEMWEEALMQAVFDHTAPQGTAATYTAAGHVRAKLASAGFTVTRAPGFGRKRHMTQAQRP